MYAPRLPVAVLTCALLLCSVVPAGGQTLNDVIRYSERLPASGGPAAGMAGAGLFAGRSAPGALFGNPAGLGWLSGSAVGSDFVGQRVRSDARLRTPDADRSAPRTVSDYRLGTLSGAYSFPTEQGSLLLGLSFHQSNTYERGFDVGAPNASTSITGTLLPSGFEVDGDDLVFDDPRSRIAYDSGAIDFSSAVFENGQYPFFQAADPQSPAVDGEMVLEQRENVFESGQMNELSFGTAVEIAPDVMLGGGLNVTFGEYTFERFYRETDESNLQPPEDPDNPQRPYDPYFLAGTDLEGFREFQLEEQIDAEINGANLRAGLSAQLTPALRGGFLVESPTWYNLTEVFGTEMRTDFDCDFSRSGLACPQGGVPGFEGGSLTGNEFEYRLRTPWRFGFGLQYQEDGLTVAGDAEFVDWTQANVSADSERFSALNRRIQALSTTLNTQFGVEYVISETSVRAGVAYRPGVETPEDNEGGTVPDVNAPDRLFLSAGASYMPSKQLTLHLNWLQERFDDSFRSYVEGPLVDERIARNRILLGLTYRL